MMEHSVITNRQSCRLACSILISLCLGLLLSGAPNPPHEAPVSPDYHWSAAAIPTSNPNDFVGADPLPIQGGGVTEAQALSTGPGGNGEVIYLEIADDPNAGDGALLQLAQSLDNNPIKFYEWVRNNVVNEFYYGVSRGAYLTYLEGAGNDMDQAALLGALFRVVGLSPTYSFGRVSIPLEASGPNQVGAYEWLGVDPGDEDALLEVLRGSGIGPEISDGVLEVSLMRLSVEVDDGNPRTLHFVPIVKPHFVARNAAPSLDSLSGYTWNALALASGSGSNSSSSPSIDRSTFRGKLTEFSVGASDSIRSSASYHDVSGAELARLPQIVPEIVSVTSPDSSHYPASATWSIEASDESYTGIPRSFCATLEVEIESSRAEFATPELLGNRLYVEFSGSRALLKHGSTSMFNEQLQGSTGSTEIKLYYTYPSAFFGGAPPSSLGNTSVGRTDPVEITYSFGKTLGRLQRTIDRISEKEAESSTNVTVGDRLNVIGEQYASQTHETGAIVTSFLRHDYARRFLGGFAFLRSGRPVVDYPLAIHRLRSRALGSGIPSDQVFSTSNLLIGALEGTAIQQSTGSQAFGTPSLFDHAMTLGIGAQYFTASSQLGSAGLEHFHDNFLGSGATAKITAALDAGKHVILLKDSNVVYNGEQMGGYLTLNPETGAMGSIIKGLNGGTSSSELGTGTISDETNDDPTSVTNTVAGQDPTMSTDPVDLTTGAFWTQHVDLEIGNESEPNSLRLSRNYNSARRNNDPTGLGRGWTHSYDLRLSHRDPTQFDSQRASYDEVLPLLIAARHIQNSIYQEPQAARTWLMACSSITWAVDQQLNSRATVTLGSRSMEFVKRPDGSYSPPGNINATLDAPSGDQQELHIRHGNTIRFRTSDGFFTTITDLYDNELTATYGNYGGETRLATVTDSYNRSLTFQYDGSRLYQVDDSTSDGGTTRNVKYGRTGPSSRHFTYTDAEGKVSTYEMNSDYLLTRIRDGRDRTVVENFYDDWHRVFRQRIYGEASRTITLGIVPGVGVETDPAGGAVWTYFDSRGRRIFEEDQNGYLSSWRHDGADRLVEAKTALGHTSTFEYDRHNVLIKETNPVGDSRTIIPDSQHLPWKVKNYEGYETVYTYTDEYQVETITAPGGMVSSFQYDGKGRLWKAHPAHYAANQVDTYTYDDFGHIDKITYPADAHPDDQDYDDLLYTSRGDLIEVIDRRDVKSTFSHNLRRQLRSSSQWIGSTELKTQIFYDDASYVDYVIDASGRKSDFDYDQMENLLTLHQGPTGEQLRMVDNRYDSRNLLEQTINALGEKTTFSYHPTHRLRTVTDPLDRVTTFGYDEDQRPTSAISPLGLENGHQTTTSPDSRGLTDAVEDSEGRIVDYTYDKDGRMDELANRRNKVFDWSYNDTARISTFKTPLGKETITTWDNRGLPESVTEPSTQATDFVDYDNEGRLLEKSDGVGTTHYTYWPNGLLHTVTESGKTTVRKYDSANRLREYQDGEGNTIRYEYHPTGELWKLTYPGGRVVTYRYDDFGRLREVEDWAQRTTTYHYDDVGRVERIDRPNNTYRIQEFDAAGQLRFGKEHRSDGSFVAFQELRFDDDGRIEYNFLHPKRVDPMLSADTLVYDDDNRLQRWNSSVDNVAHDDDGNMTVGPLPDGTFGTYAYDARNRLLSAGGNSYRYSPDGMRVEVMGSGAASYVVDPNAVLSRTLIRTKGSSTTFYVYGLGLLYEDTAGVTKTYHYDQMGSTIALTDSSENVTDSWSYSEFGVVTDRTGVSDTVFQFHGSAGVMTDANGLNYMRARYYNPRLMRFITADPIGFSGGMNWYVAFANDPISHFDPLGLEASSGPYAAGWFGSVVRLKPFVLTASDPNSVASPEAGDVRNYRVKSTRITYEGQTTEELAEELGVTAAVIAALMTVQSVPIGPATAGSTAEVVAQGASEVYKMSVSEYYKAPGLGDALLELPKIIQIPLLRHEIGLRTEDFEIRIIAKWQVYEENKFLWFDGWSNREGRYLFKGERPGPPSPPEFQKAHKKARVELTK